MITGSLAIAVLFALLAFFAPIGSTAMTPWLLGLLGLFTCFPMIRWVGKARIDFFEIIYPISFSYCVYFVLTSPGALQDPLNPYVWIASEHINQALLYTAIGFAAVLLGYYGPLPALISKALPRLNMTADPPRARWVIYFLYGVGTAFRLYLLAIGSGTWSVKQEEIDYGTVIQGPLANLVGYFGNCSFFAYVLAAAFFFTPCKTKTLAVFLWGVMFPLECLWAFLQASKLQLIPVLIAPAIAYNYLRENAKIHHLALPALLFVFGVFPIVTAYREIAAEYPIQLSTLPSTLPLIVKDLAEETAAPESSTRIQRGPGLVSERAGGLMLFSNVIYYVHLKGVIHGETLWQFPLLLVPTIFLPTKYVHLDYGAQFYSEVLGSFSTTSGIALMHIGEFYLNFGLAGVLIGMFLQGILYRLWQIYWVGLGGPLGIALFILGWRMLISIEFPIAVAYGLLMREVFIMVPVLWFITLGRSREGAA